MLRISQVRKYIIIWCLSALNVVVETWSLIEQANSIINEWETNYEIQYLFYYNFIEISSIVWHNRKCIFKNPSKLKFMWSWKTEKQRDRQPGKMQQDNKVNLNKYISSFLMKYYITIQTIQWGIYSIFKRNHGLLYQIYGARQHHNVITMGNYIGENIGTNCITLCH